MKHILEMNPSLCTETHHFLKIHHIVNEGLVALVCKCHVCEDISVIYWHPAFMLTFYHKESPRTTIQHK